MMQYPHGKVELHLHLDGSIRPATAWELTAEQGLRLPVATYQECERAMRVGDGCADLLAYFETFQIPSMVLHQARALERVTSELIEDLARDGVAYAEIRFAPQLHTGKGLTQQQALEAVLAGRAQAAQQHAGPQIGLILCAMCGPDPSSNREANFETLRLAKAHQDQNVAFDLAGGEGLSPIRAYKELFDEATRAGLPFTVHAGEAYGAENVREVLSWGATRIGHGCRAAESKEVMRLLRDAGTVLEMCPTSNVQTKAQSSYAQHAIRALYDDGIRVTVNTDNRTCSNTTLEEEYALLRAHLGFTDDDFRQMNRYALGAAFLPASLKADVKARL